MGFYKRRELYSEGLAEAHPVVRHNQPVSDLDKRLRVSFFRINDEAELDAASKKWIHFPCIVMVGLSGGYFNRDGSIRQLNINTWMILQKRTIDPNNPFTAPAITDAYDITFDVMQDLIRTICAEYEENEGCGEFKKIDPGKFKWEQVGPIGDQLYGWILNFSDETRQIR